MPVSFPNVQESFQRSIDTILGFYFRGGNTRTVGGISIDFTDCDIVYDIRLLKLSSGKPLIAILGTRTSPVISQKCHIAGQIAYQKRQTVHRTIYIKVDKFEGDESKGKRLADRTWDQLTAVMDTQGKAFADHGIYNVEFSSVPADQSNEDSALLRGSLDCEIRYEHLNDS